MMELKAGMLLQNGKYRIERMLGQGGFGITYKASTKQMLKGNLGTVNVEAQVVIKEFFMKENCMRADDTSAMIVPNPSNTTAVNLCHEKFKKEASNLAALDHPHIVKVIDEFDENGTSYYVMQYLKGGSLKDYLDNYGPLKEANAVECVVQIGSALDYMHNVKHMCHLDVKPGNIMLDDDGNAMLIDFGISKNYKADGGETSGTPVGVSKGFAPMEQYSQSLQEFSPMTDVYSLGATLYALIVGEAPVEAAVVGERGLGEKPQAMSQRTWQAIVNAMRFSRNGRTPSVRAFINELGRDLPATNAAPAPAEVSVVSMPQMPAGMATPPQAAAYVPPMPNPAQKPMQQPMPANDKTQFEAGGYPAPADNNTLAEPQKKKSNILWWILGVILAAAAIGTAAYFIIDGNSGSRHTEKKESSKKDKSESESEEESGEERSYEFSKDDNTNTGGSSNALADAINKQLDEYNAQLPITDQDSGITIQRLLYDGDSNSLILYLYNSKDIDNTQLCNLFREELKNDPDMKSVIDLGIKIKANITNSNGRSNLYNLL